MLKKMILNILVILIIMTITGNSQIINLSNSGHTASVHPWVVGFDNGKVMVVWMEGCQADKVNPRDIYYTLYSNGSWSTPTAAFPNPGKIAKNPHLELAPDGVVHLVWGEDDPDRDVFHGTYSNGAWRNKAKIFDSPYNSNWMKVGILGDGTVNVNWCSAQSGGISQYWRTRNTWKPVGAGWVGTAPYISKNTPYNYGTDGWDLAMHPGIACRGTKTYGVWHEGNHSKMTVKFAHKTGNGSFTNPVNVWPTGSLYYRPDIVVDSNYNIHIICFKGANVRYKGLINGSWTEERLISNGGVVKGFVDIDVDSNNNLHSVYQVGSRIFYNTGTTMGVWGDEIVISNGDDDQHSSCDAADDGYIHIVWCTHDETEDGNIMYTRIRNPNWGEITVTSPKTDDIYATGGAIPFHWTSEGISGDVDIKIRNEETKTKYHVATVPYDNSPHNYDIPQWIPAGYYRAGVLQGSILGKTGIFSIMGINITSGHTGESYGVGSYIPMTWTAGGMTGNINVNLVASGDTATYPLESVP
ncbi:MAG: hypothetical protein KAT34_11695, partial [Candidatus Aminicenantes bacterium]|nr:hypothetical protein [Candidatus Aminicenantes bacterium]